MRIRRTSTIAGLVVGLLFPGAVFARVDTSLTVEPHRQILGLPYEVRIELANRSAEAIEAVWPKHMVLVLQDPGLWVLPGGGGVLAPIGGFSAAVTITYQQVEPRDRLVYTLQSDRQITSLPRFCSPGNYRIGVRVPVRLSDGNEVTSEAWTDVEVVTPEGVDVRAFAFLYGCEVGEGQECSCSRRVVYGPPGSSSGELLRRFPSSTYAAYVVWKRTWPGLAPARADVPLYGMERGLASFPPTSLPCVDPQSAACKDVGFPPTGLEGAKRQAAWLDLALRHHPDIWFGDELRYRRAVSAFFLDDKDACAAGLEDLAAHGRPDVAAKAKDLLAAMQTKEMLPEKGGMTLLSLHRPAGGLAGPSGER